MKGTLLQLYYKSELNINLNDNITLLFNYVYLSYKNFSIENKFLESKFSNKFGGNNLIKIPSNGNFLSNLAFRVELFELDTVSTYDNI